MNMKKIAVVLMLAVSAAGLLADAMARPMGGGRSIGRQSSNVARQAPAPAPAAPRQATPAPAAPATPTPAPAVQPKPASPWKGILGGALLGLGLGALLSHFGMGAAMASMFGSLIMIGLLVLVVWFIYRLFRRGTGAGGTAFQGNFGGGNAMGGDFSGNAPLPQGAGGTPEIGSRLQSQPQPFQHLQPPASPSGVSLDKPAAIAPWGVPADFDSAAFLRHAKTNFIRLQAAWDKADVNDIREFTTPEVYAELKMQIQERGGNADFTDVVNIDAELMGIETGDKDYLASVKFTGQIRSAPGALAEPFAEVWNLAKPLAGDGGWLLAGIQQLP